MLVVKFYVTFTNLKQKEMSRIGNNPVAIPEGVTVDVKDNVVTVKGKLGELTQDYDTVEIKSRRWKRIGNTFF